MFMKEIGLHPFDLAQDLLQRHVDPALLDVEERLPIDEFTVAYR